MNDPAPTLTDEQEAQLRQLRADLTEWGGAEWCDVGRAVADLDDLLPRDRLAIVRDPVAAEAEERQAFFDGIADLVRRFGPPPADWGDGDDLLRELYDNP